MDLESIKEEIRQVKQEANQITAYIYLAEEYLDGLKEELRSLKEAEKVNKQLFSD